MMLRRKQSLIFSCLFAFFFIVFFRLALPAKSEFDPKSIPRQERFPRVWKHIHHAAGHGGAWYLPPDWLPQGVAAPTNITHAAQLAAWVAKTASQHRLPHSSMPSIVHQAWKSTDIDQFPELALPAIETWLSYAVDDDSPSMAYFMWDDQGIRDLMVDADSETLPYFDALPKAVQKADLFRVVVCNSIGGVYGDVDTTPLQHPASWIRPEDVAPWVDPETHTMFANDQANSSPVGLVLGIEADTNEHSTSYWRMGYFYPVQLTQWALAGTKQHPVLNLFLQNFRDKMNETLEASRNETISENGDKESNLQDLDTLSLTGPAAITKATKDYLADNAKLRWQALSGLEDGGRSKLVLDTLILPITGFSPGRGRYGNMGSKPFSHPDARLRHDAQGSWKKFDLMVELGKTCRTLFGACQNWSKYSSAE